MQWWQRLNESIDANSQTTRFMQLATVRDDGSPANRTVVYRGMSEDHHLLMISDARSQKFAQLLSNPKAEICWYFYDSREQYRITGDVHCLLPNEDDQKNNQELNEIWNNLSLKAQQQYQWPNPGIPIPSDSELEQIAKNATLNQQVRTGHPPMHFCVLKMYASHVDYLQLTQPIHKHVHYHYDDHSNTWRASVLTP